MDSKLHVILDFGRVNCWYKPYVKNQNTDDSIMVQLYRLCIKALNNWSRLYSSFWVGYMCNKTLRWYEHAHAMSSWKKKVFLSLLGIPFTVWCHKEYVLYTNYMVNLDIYFFGISIFQTTTLLKCEMVCHIFLKA